MTEDEVEVLARAAGLGKIMAEHATDVAAAVASAHRHRTAFLRSSDPAAEPMPAFALPHPAVESTG